MGVGVWQLREDINLFLLTWADHNLAGQNLYLLYRGLILASIYSITQKIWLNDLPQIFDDNFRSAEHICIKFSENIGE